MNSRLRRLWGVVCCRGLGSTKLGGWVMRKQHDMMQILFQHRALTLLMTTNLINNLNPAVLFYGIVHQFRYSMQNKSEIPQKLHMWSWNLFKNFTTGAPVLAPYTK